MAAGPQGVVRGKQLGTEDTFNILHKILDTVQKGLEVSIMSAETVHLLKDQRQGEKSETRITFECVSFRPCVRQLVTS